MMSVQLAVLRVSSWMTEWSPKVAAWLVAPAAICLSWMLTLDPAVLPDWIASDGRLSISRALLGVVAFLAALTLVVEFTHRVLEVHGAKRYLGYSMNTMLLHSIPSMRLLRMRFFPFAFLNTAVIPIVLWVKRLFWKDAPGWIELSASSWWIVCYAYVALMLAGAVVGIFRMTVQKPHVLMWRQQDATLKKRIELYFKTAWGKQAASAARRGKLREWVGEADSWIGEVESPDDARLVVQKAIAQFEARRLILESASYWKSLVRMSERERDARVRDLLSYIEYSWRGPRSSGGNDAAQVLAAGLMAARRHARLLGRARREFSSGTTAWTGSTMPRMRPWGEAPTAAKCDAAALGDLIVSQAADLVVRASDSERRPGVRVDDLELVVRELEDSDDRGAMRRRTASVLLGAIERVSMSGCREEAPRELRRYLGYGIHSSDGGRSDVDGLSEIAWRHLTKDQEYSDPYSLEVCVSGLSPQEIVLAAVFEYLACERRHARCECVERLSAWLSGVSSRRGQRRIKLPTGVHAHSSLEDTAIRYCVPSSDELQGLFDAVSEDLTAVTMWGEWEQRAPVLGWRHFLLLKVIADEVCVEVRRNVAWRFYPDEPENEFDADQRKSNLDNCLAWLNEFSSSRIPWVLQPLNDSIRMEQHRIEIYLKKFAARESAPREPIRGSIRQARRSRVPVSRGKLRSRRDRR